jgi:hypothetical protein
MSGVGVNMVVRLCRVFVLLGECWFKHSVSVECVVSDGGVLM